MTDFPGRQANETVVTVFRKHPIVYFRIGLIFFVSVLLPLIIFLSFWLNRFPLFPVLKNDTVGLIGYLGASLYSLYGLALLVIALLDNIFDIFILTDHRLIDITQNNLVNRTVATTPLGHIEDTASDVAGVLGTLLNYGTVTIETASARDNKFIIDHVSNPSLVARTILNQAELLKTRKGLDPDDISDLSMPEEAI